MRGKVVGVIVLSSILCFAPIAFGMSFDKHPVSPDDIQSLKPQYQQCAVCHKDVTPEVYKSWARSKHAIANVKCYQCHGTFENFHKVPPISKCESCHYQEVKTMKLRAPKMSCWDCHPAHIFRFHDLKTEAKK